MIFLLLAISVNCRKRSQMSDGFTNDPTEGITGLICADHLPGFIDRVEHAIHRLLDAVPDFEGGDRLAGQLGTEIANLRESARDACRRAGVSWTSEYDQRRTEEIRARIFGPLRSAVATDE